MGTEFRKGLTKAREERRKRTKTLIPHDDFIEHVMPNGIIYARAFRQTGELSDVTVDIGKGDQIRGLYLEAMVEGTRSGKDVTKKQKLILGRNNLGDFDIQDGDRFILRMISTEGAPVGEIYNIFFNATFTY